MMLIPHLNVGSTNASSVTANYFPAHNLYTTGVIGELASDIAHSQGSVGSRLACGYPPIEDRMLATKMQSDLPGFHMYAAAAVATGQPVSSALNSPANYVGAAAPTPTHTLVPPHYGPSTIDPSSYYTSLGSGYDMKSNDMWGGGYGQAAATYYQYDAGFAPQYPYDRYCNVDMNDGVRRKNATRESTNTLKAWLQEHKKNPYPTKGEKIMLAIITKMTLTQVSTWFANARRRLKKENKMTWVPKNRANESGSGADERRASDDKDTDEKTEDEDCKSEKNDDDDEGQEDTKREITSETNSSCQYTQSETASMQLPNVHTSTEPGPFPTEDNSFNTTDLQKPKSKEEYQHPIAPQNPCNNTEMLHSNASMNSTLDPKVHDAAMPSSTRYRYDLAGEAYHRSIWSPIDVHSSKSVNAMPRSCHHGYNNDYYYQGGYPHESHHIQARRLSSNPQTYHADCDAPQLLRQTSLPPNSQECLPTSNEPPVSYSGGKIASPDTTDTRDRAENMVSGHVDANSMDLCDVARRNDYNLTSPVTNLRNWVNGVFHGPEYSGSSGQDVPRDKGTMAKSPKQQNVTETMHGLPPNNRGNYGGMNYSHRHMHHGSSMGFSKPLSVGGIMNEPYSLQHRAQHSFDSTGYYREPGNQDVTTSFSQHATADNMAASRVPYYPNTVASSYHHPPAVISVPDIGGGSGMGSSAAKLSQPFSMGDNSSMALCQRVVAESPVSANATPHNPQRLARHCESMSSENSANCQSLSHYCPSTAKTTPISMSTAPPPPPPPPQYATECKYVQNIPHAYLGGQSCSEYPLAHATMNSGTQLDFDNMDPSSNQRTLSPLNSHAGTSIGEESSYGCKMSPSDDAMKLRPIHAGGASPDNSAKP